MTGTRLALRPTSSRDPSGAIRTRPQGLEQIPAIVVHEHQRDRGLQLALEPQPSLRGLEPRAMVQARRARGKSR